jgi:hypothetical protein
MLDKKLKIKRLDKLEEFNKKYFEQFKNIDPFINSKDLFKHINPYEMLE